MLNHNFLLRLLICLVMIVAAFFVVQAQENTTVKASFANIAKETISINVLVGQSRVIDFDKPLGRFSISNPEIAEAVVITPTQALVNGKAFGQVNFIAWEKESDRFIVFDVYVRVNLSLIDSQIRALFPKDDIRLSQANGSVVLSGTVSQPYTVQQAEAVVQAAGFKTVNLLQGPVKDATQVQLQVRVAEVSRARLKELGASYAYQSKPGTGGFIGTGGGPFAVGNVRDDTGKLLNGSIFSTLAGSALNLFIMGGNNYEFIRALQTQGALRSLAEPNLIAMDGQKASFLAGGEFPVPVVQGGSGSQSAVTVMFKEYGVRLNFTPTIIDEDHIRLEMEPEVSTIDFSNGVKFNGFLIPALRTRRAKTGVELRDGQSFALAGLLDNSETRSLSKIPLLGDIPVLGALFKSKSFQKQETELMIIVTAQVVKPVNRDELPKMRGIDGLKSNGSLLNGEPKDEGIKGQSGYSTGTNSGNGQSSPSDKPEAKPATTKQTPASNTNDTVNTSTSGANSTVQTQSAPNVGAKTNKTPIP